MQDECDEKQVDCEDSKIVRLEADKSFEASYTFFDVRFMRDGGTYWMGSRKCCWLCIDGVGQNLTLKEMRELLQICRMATQFSSSVKLYHRLSAI
jgi:hypothetical protein